MKINTKQKITAIVLGLVFCIVLLETGIRLTGIVFLSIQDYKNRRAVKQKGTYRILCLGDSMTANKFPKPLERVLNKEMPEIKFSVIDKGIPGADSSRIMSILNESIDRYNPDMIIVMMGNFEWGKLLPYGDINVSRATPLKSYKLAQLLWSNILDKNKRRKKLNIENGGPVNSKTLLQTSNLKKSTNAEIQSKNLTRPNFNNAKKYIGLKKNSKRKFLDLEREKNCKGKYFFVEDIGTNPKGTLRLNHLSGLSLNKAEEMFKKAIKIDPQNITTRFSLGQFYWRMGKINKVEEMFGKALKECDTQIETYLKLDHSDTKQKQVYIPRRIVGRIVDRFFISGMLGRVYNDQEKYHEAEKILEEAILKTPINGRVQIGRENNYKYPIKNGKTKEMLKKIIEEEPRCFWVYIELARSYKCQHKYDMAEKSLKRAINLHSGNHMLYGQIALLYAEQGENRLSEKYFRKAEKLRLELCNPRTIRNYQRLKRIVTQKGIKLVCMQYPTRNVNSLKKMLEPHGNIIFVDNEKIFKEAIKQEGIDEYFIDMCGGDYGHYTPKGNRLLAENIANTILKEVFNK